MSAPLVLLWADAYIDVDEARELCDGRCTLSVDQTDFARADAVIFPIPTVGGALPDRRAFPDQLWVQWCQESASQYPPILHDAFNARFDLRMTYRLDSDVPIPYLAPGMFDALPTIEPANARDPVAVSAWISSKWDRCGRDDYLLALMDQMPVHSFGKIGHNRDLSDDNGRDSKLTAIRRYRFTLAFENSTTTDYVTEKIFQPLLVGSVPIYRGAPNVADFAPAPHSYIDAAGFSGPRELAEFLSTMTDDEYMRYHEWRQEGPTPEWRARFAPFNAHAFVRLAQAIEAVRYGRLAARRPQA